MGRRAKGWMPRPCYPPAFRGRSPCQVQAPEKSFSERRDKNVTSCPRNEQSCGPQNDSSSHLHSSSVLGIPRAWEPGFPSRSAAERGGRVAGPCLAPSAPLCPPCVPGSRALSYRRDSSPPLGRLRTCALASQLAEGRPAERGGMRPFPAGRRRRRPCGQPRPGPPPSEAGTQGSACTGPALGKPQEGARGGGPRSLEPRVAAPSYRRQRAPAPRKSDVRRRPHLGTTFSRSHEFPDTPEGGGLSLFVFRRRQEEGEEPLGHKLPFPSPPFSPFPRSPLN